MADEETVTPAEAAEFMDSRETFYRFLSHALLYEYSADQVEQLKGMGVPDVGSPEVEESFAAIRRYLSLAGADPRTDLAVDYARIFLSAGVYDGRTAEPYESAFTSEDHILMQESRDECVAVYRAEGVDVDPELHLPEDHLGLQFNFLAVMAGKCAAVLRDPDGSAAELARLLGVQVDFIDQHILNWIDELIEKVDEFAKLPYYPALMRIAKGYVQADREDLAQMRDGLA